MRPVFRKNLDQSDSGIMFGCSKNAHGSTGGSDGSSESSGHSHSLRSSKAPSLSGGSASSISLRNRSSWVRFWFVFIRSSTMGRRSGQELRKASHGRAADGRLSWGTGNGGEASAELQLVDRAIARSYIGPDHLESRLNKPAIRTSRQVLDLNELTASQFTVRHLHATDFAPNASIQHQNRHSIPMWIYLPYLHSSAFNELDGEVLPCSSGLIRGIFVLEHNAFRTIG